MNNILSPGYPAEMLDDQIKKIYKNLTIKQRMNRRRRNIQSLNYQQRDGLSEDYNNMGSMSGEADPNNMFLGNLQQSTIAPQRLINLTIQQTSIDEGSSQNAQVNHSEEGCSSPIKVFDSYPLLSSIRPPNEVGFNQTIIKPQTCQVQSMFGGTVNSSNQVFSAEPKSHRRVISDPSTRGTQSLH